MATFIPGQPVQTTDPSIEVSVTPANPLPPGKHTFRLVVVDDSGNESLPAEVEVIVTDTQRPTAVIDAPRKVSFGSSFTLSGARSADAAPGRIAKYIWTQIA